MRPELPPKFLLSTGIVFALMLAALIAARTGYVSYVWEAAPISPAFADGHKSSSRSEGGGEREGGSSSSQHSSDGGGGTGLATAAVGRALAAL